MTTWTTLRRLACGALVFAASATAALAAEGAGRPATTAAPAVWRTVALGTYRSVNVLREALDTTQCGLAEPTASAGPRTPRCVLGESAAEAIGRPAFSLSRTRSEINLAVVTVSQLGFPEGASLADVYARARQIGLELCPAEVGPLLRLQYLDQPLGEFLHVAMKPIAAYGGGLVDFTLANTGAGLTLLGGDGRPDLVMHPGVRFVFVRPVQVARPGIAE